MSATNGNSAAHLGPSVLRAPMLRAEPRHQPPVLPPHDISAEEAVIAALLLDEDALTRVLPILRPRDFFREQHQWCYEACEALTARGEPITIPTLAHELDHVGHLDAIGGEPALVEIAGRHFTAKGVEAHARIVARDALYRRLISAAGQMAQLAYEGGPDAAAVLLAADAMLEPLRAAGMSVINPLNGLIDWGTFWSDGDDEADWLIEPMLPRGRSIVIYAPAKLGKSLLALDLAAHAATGGRVLDTMINAPIDVLHLDYEMMTRDLRERLTDMGFGSNVDMSHLHYYLLPDLPPLDTPEGGAALLRLVREHHAELVTIDATARALIGPENDSDTMRAYWRYTGLPLKREGVTVLRVDNAGKDAEKGQRGTSGKNDDPDVVWQLAAHKGGIRLRATHRRQSWVPEVVDLVRLDDPLRHALAATKTYPVGTEALARRLDDLDVPLDLPVSKVQTLLRVRGGRGVRKALLTAAIGMRRATGTGSQPPGTAPSEPNREPLHETPISGPGTAREPLGTGVAGDWEPVPPSKGEPSSQPSPEPPGPCRAAEGLGEGERDE